ncbi:histidine kinase [Salinibacterium sp. G-O1]|uniref:sensor histidine kinase n=1 Tax=Salinibacterium sp. G-O1 TaxID=3046208 RepID=UPI0024BB5186|nr:histidine kinase [Salinibacterium sp. G-O1]MDJ0333816.1 histidine kinase [Salinibacterium sp. G-O1]
MSNLSAHISRNVTAYFRWIPVLGASVYLTLWSIGEASRMTGGGAFVMVLFTIAIGLSGFFPLVSLTLVTLIPALQLFNVLYPPSANGWAMYQAVGIVGLVVAFGAEGRVRRFVLPMGALASILLAARMMLPSQQGYWTSWVGTTSNVTNRPHWEGFIFLVLVAFGFFFGMWAIGVAGRSRLRERAIGFRLHKSNFDLRLADDRARISRDVHDALAHSLAVILSQAEGALALQGKRPDVATEALTNIASVGRVALTDVRSLVESIHDDDLTLTRPVILDLDAVVSRMRKVGMDATMQSLGIPRELTPSRELAVFRIVQESLTNALKHGGSTSTARVTLDWQGRGLALLITSRSVGDAGMSVVSPGVGIVGMKERARLAGGWLTAERDGHEFLVTAFIPAQPVAATPEPAGV